GRSDTQEGDQGEEGEREPVRSNESQRSELLRKKSAQEAPHHVYPHGQGEVHAEKLRPIIGSARFREERRSRRHLASFCTPQDAREEHHQTRRRSNRHPQIAYGGKEPGSNEDGPPAHSV